jgi:Holliday junction resolvasome RuvABC DNA-binding subunit
MNKRNRQSTQSLITCDITTLQEITGLGRQNAERIAKAAGAKIKVGRRTLYSVQKVEEYMSGLAERGQEKNA